MKLSAKHLISAGLRLATTTIQLQPIPLIPGQQLNSHVTLEGPTKLLTAAPGAMAQPEVVESSAENPLDIAMREINEGFVEEKLGFEREPEKLEPSLISEINSSWTGPT